MASTFLQYSLLITISERSRHYFTWCNFGQKQFVGHYNYYSSPLILIANRFPIKLQDKVL